MNSSLNRSSTTSNYFYIGLVIIWIILLASPLSMADAHSTLEKTYPQAGVTLEKSPTKVELWFQDPVVIHSQSIKVTNETGIEVQNGRTTYVDVSDKRHVTVTLKRDIPSGTYTVQYNVIAPDGYVLQDRFAFKVEPQVPSEKGVHENLKLVKTIPSDGEIVKNGPTQIELWFNRPAHLTAFGVFDDHGGVVETKSYKIDPDNPSHIRIEWAGELSTGTYQMNWFATPNKGEHRLESQGGFYFAVKEFTSMASDYGISNVHWYDQIGVKSVGYWLAFVGLLTMAGGTWFCTVIAKEKGNLRRWKRTSLVLYGISIIGLFLVVLQRSIDLTQLAFTELISLRFMWVPILQMVLLSFAYWLSKGKSRMLLYILTLILWPIVSGHSAYPRYGGGFTMAVDVLHVLGVAIWLGGLLALLIMMPKKNEQDWLADVGRTYSKWAFWSMIVIVVTGIWMALEMVPSFTLGSLMGSHWGRALLAKVLLTVAIIVLGYLQRRSIQRYTANLIRSFNKRGRMELLYAILLLFAASLLIESTPSAAEQGIYPDTVVQNGKELSVDIAPFRIGANTITMDFKGDVDFKKVDVEFSMPPNWGMEHRAFSIGNGTYKLTGTFMHASGTMYMKVKALKKNGEIITFPFKIVVPGEIRYNE